MYCLQCLVWHQPSTAKGYEKCRTVSQRPTCRFCVAGKHGGDYTEPCECSCHEKAKSGITKAARLTDTDLSMLLTLAVLNLHPCTLRVCDRSEQAERYTLLLAERLARKPRL